MTNVEERDAARAILLTPQHEVLLMRVRPPEGGEAFWITPGGGMEPGETLEVCLRRELREELGLDEFALGPLVWRRQHTFSWGHRWIRQREQYHIVSVHRFEPQMSDALEMTTLEQFRWWPAHELACASERLTPLTLAARYLREGAPAGPISLEVVAD